MEARLDESGRIQAQLEKETITQLTELAQENAILKHRLVMLEPSNVTDDDLKELLSAHHNLALTTLAPKLKQDISDFYQQKPDLDWRYRKQHQP